MVGCPPPMRRALRWEKTYDQYHVLCPGKSSYDSPPPIAGFPSVSSKLAPLACAPFNPPCTTAGPLRHVVG